MVRTAPTGLRVDGNVGARPRRPQLRVAVRHSQHLRPGRSTVRDGTGGAEDRSGSLVGPEGRRFQCLRVDVAIVGGGIAEGAMATVLARAGLKVLLLERDVPYRDRVRGETMFPWGVDELQQMGLSNVLRDVGAGFTRNPRIGI